MAQKGPKEIANREEIISKALDNFRPMTEEEQKLLTFIAITSYVECLEGMENAPNLKIKENWYKQASTYELFLSFFVKPMVKEIDAKEFLLKQAQREYEKMFGKEVKA